MLRVKKESAAPFRPLLPARPTRCVYCSTLPGMSPVDDVFEPRDVETSPATSVATSTGDLPLLKSLAALVHTLLLELAVPACTPSRRAV